MRKRIISALLIVISILGAFATGYAVDTGIECSNITFVDANGDNITALNAEPITAKVTVIKNTSGKKPVLLVCSFENEMLNGVWYKSAIDFEGEISVPFTPVVGANTVIKASVIDGLKTLNNPTATAQALKESIGLTAIKVNGEPLEDYTDEITTFKKLVSKDDDLKIDVIPEDGGTKVEIEKSSAFAQVVRIKLTSKEGNRKTINLALYTDEAQLFSPTKVCYEVDGEIYEIENFAQDTYEYDITLPDNTFYVTVMPQTLNITNTKVRVQDVDHRDKTFGGVSYFNGGFTGETEAYYLEGLEERPSYNNLIPIKNEETKAIIKTSYEGKEAVYTINFKSKQPRLTEFTVAEEVKKVDLYQPIFIGGAAANNDNGSFASADRVWALANISENLIGASMFVVGNRADDAGQSGNDWIEKNTSGQYFSFTADTAGTIYFMGKTVSNTEWNIQSGSHTSDGNWRLVGTSASVALPWGYSSWKASSLPRNVSAGNGAYLANIIEWTSLQYVAKENGKFADNAITRNLVEYVETLGSTYARTFEAGEQVIIYHPGSAYNKKTFFIKWDLH